MREAGASKRRDAAPDDPWASFEDPERLRAFIADLVFVPDAKQFTAAIDEAVEKGWMRRNGDGTLSSTDLGAAAYDTHFGRGAGPLDPADVKALRARLAGPRTVTLRRQLTTVAAFLARSRGSKAVLLREIRAAALATAARWPLNRVALKELYKARDAGWLILLGHATYQVTPEGFAAEARSYARSALPRKVRRILPRLVKRARATTLTRRFTVIGHHASEQREPRQFTLDDLREGYDALGMLWPRNTTAANALAKAIRRKWIVRRSPATYAVTALGGRMVEERFAETA